jgi:diamine N-acetyltransferase
MEIFMSQPTKDSIITLREITEDNLREVLKLNVSEVQNQFVAPNPVSVAQAYFKRERAWFRGIYADDTAVGFVMLHDDSREAIYFLWRFMIDERYQGKWAKTLCALNAPTIWL